ncbi:MAG: UvrD-helicase domain-containing protein [Rhodospirillaceae bacterium]|nr:UvrD-helicase domain-containing protein [Rhodospirillaceae bacterium]MDE0618505.1 UvrD-helicase domain-containing protein [Rhodospirillaceae bacterium]
MTEPAADPLPLSRRAAVAPSAADDPVWLDGLNDKQREAVEKTGGAVLVLAGAGTGKTRALTVRIAHILATRRAMPWQILAVTFTNRAAREMRERVGRLVAPLIGQEAAEDIWLGTFHALAARILRRHAELVGLKSNFTILDPDDQLRLVKQELEAADIDTKRWPPRLLHWMIERWKDKGKGPEQVTAADAGDFAGGRAAELYAAYQDRLRSLNAVDFGDLLLHNLTVLMQHDDILAKYNDRFRYILVDEYQDTNVAQYLWLRLLAQKDGNICCVGDDDQSIYGWRGAEIENILRFEKDFPGAAVIRLEQNYRSTAPILAAASRLIARNDSRLGKTLWTAAEGGDKLTLTGVWDGEEEARSIADRVEDLQRKAHALNEIAILVRAGFQTREFEERFITLNIPYRVIGGPRFYERLEIRDAVAYLRLVHSTDDDLAFERIVNKPRRGLGDAAMRALHGLRAERGASLFEAARLAASSGNLRPQARRALDGFVSMVERWRRLAETASHVEVAETVLDESGYTAMWQQDKGPDAPGRLENLKELVRALAEFENLGGFLEHIALVMEATGSTEADMVNVMTLHSAKGLEFDTVFLPGWEEGVFPHPRTLNENGIAGLEEERRLAHVGLTRARKNVHISFAANRRIHNQWASNLPSRFIDELPPEHVEVATEQGLYAGRSGAPGGTVVGAGLVEAGGGQRAGGFGDGFGGGAGQGNRDRFDDGWNNTAPLAPNSGGHGGGRKRIARDKPVIIDGEANLIRSGGDSAFKQGDHVRNEKFGKGVVKAIEGDKLTVIFESVGAKKVFASFVEPA